MKRLSLFVLAALTVTQGLSGVSRSQESSNKLIGPLMWPLRKGSTGSPASPGSEKSVLSEQISVRAKGRGHPWINLSDGHELVSSYTGDPKLVRELGAGGSRPLSLASADLDEDGVPDLVTGLAIGNEGIIAVYRGNVDSIYPNTPEAQARKREASFTDAPFLSPARLFAVPSTPDFLGTGDFDADGHTDIAVAARGSDTIFFLSGDGSGGMGAAKAVKLPGSITAMTSGDVNRADGLTDLIVGIAATEGPRLLVFEGAEGAFGCEPEVIRLPGEATAVAVGRLYGGTYADIAVAAGGYLFTIHGRDRKLSLDEAARAGVSAPETEKLRLGSRPRSIAIGDFAGDRREQVAVLLENGTIEAVEAGNPNWSQKTMRDKVGLSSGGWAPGSYLLPARVSGRAGHDLILADASANKLRVLVSADRRSAEDATLATYSGPDAAIELDVDEMPVAALTMRLNIDARSDLVLLRRGRSSPSVVLTGFDHTYLVNTASDGGAADLSSVPSSSWSSATTPEAIPAGPLRPCISLSNSDGGNNLIEFQIPGAGVPSIVLQSALPQLTTGTTIDGTTQPGGLVEINGAGLGVDALVGTSSSNVLRGLVINRSANGIMMEQGTGSIIEGNFIGTDSSGELVRGNSLDGLFISGSSNNTLGGTANSAINVISGNNGNGVTINGANATGNVVRLNIIGADTNQQNLLGNGLAGVLIDNGASGNTIGGTATGFVNIIAGSARAGVSIVSASAANLVQRNQIQQNNFSGVVLLAPTNTIGGNPNANLTNGLWLNKQDGVFLNTAAATNDLVQGNLIGVGFSNGKPTALGNTLSGVSIGSGASHNSIGGTPTVFGNDIDLNQGDGVRVSSGTGNSILTNRIIGNAGLAIHLFPGANDNQQPPTITSATLTGTVGRPVTPAAAAMVINFKFHDQPNQNFRLQFFIPTICDCTDPSCIQPDLTVYTLPVTTDVNGDAPSPVTINLTSAPPPNSFVNATATNSNVSTSQYSECVQIGTASACIYSISPQQSPALDAGGASGSFTVTTASNCNWTPTPSDGWITIKSGNGPGNGTVNYSVAANPNTNGRAGTITVVQGVTYFVNQAGAGSGPDFALSFDSPTIPGPAGTKVPVTLNITRTGGFTGEVIITPPDPSGGIKAKPPDPAATTDSTYRVKLKIAGGAPLGPHQLIFTGADDSGKTHSVTLTVVVQ
jgi:hypothetical protein